MADPGMDTTHASLKRFNRSIWIAIAIVAATVLASTLIGSFRIEWTSFARSGVIGVLLAAAGWYYSAFRNEPQLSAALMGTSQVIAFALVGAPLSYIAAAAGLPLWDTTFVTWDKSLGFEWTAWLRFMNEHPKLHTIFALSYTSFPVQATMIIMALAWTRQLTRLHVFVLAFILTTIVTIALSALIPAQGVWGQLQLSNVDHPAIAPITQRLHLPIFHGLRDGTWQLLTGEGAEGIITFPSLHAAIGLLFILAAWPVPYVRWAAVLANTTMIAATPIDGGHYFSDVIAGLAIAAACWLAVARLAADAPNETADAVEAIADAPSLVPESNAATHESDRPLRMRERV